MSFKKLQLKRTYSSENNDILQEFYLPVLQDATEYNRLAGFFSSTSIAIAARGIIGLIRNKGKMKIIACPKLTKEDVNAIIDAKENPEKYITIKMMKELDGITEEFVKDHVYALGWMIANNILDIKIAIVHDDMYKPLNYEEIQSIGIFHQKVGILKDSEGNIVTFSGSVNESASGWIENIEEFKVFRSWIPVEEEYVKSDIEKFTKFWENKATKVKVIDIPESLREKLIKFAPKDIDDLHLERWYQKNMRNEINRRIELYEYQKDAIDAWIRNNMRGIFEMATGTGKTSTALGCADKIFERMSKILLIITCPYQHIANQWRNEIKKFRLSHDKIIEAHSGKSWRDVFVDSLIDLELGHINRLIVLTTHTTFYSDDFIKIIKDNKKNIKIFLIADEVHWLGAEKLKKGLIEEYDFRLGLSATPRRWFDIAGTQILYDYFGDVIFEFSLSDAIMKINPATHQTYLTPYMYKPYFVSLTDNELNEYFEKTKSIVHIYNRANSDEKKNKIIETLLFNRANIVKNAFNKYSVLEEILNKLGKDIQYTIIYCTPQQIDRVMDIVNKRGLIAHRFTMDEGTTPDKKYNNLSEREYLLNKFSKGEYKVLVAMKCLDEGVDVPPARTAILMASSGNPREYIQRIGRIIRRAPGKDRAIIYDIIVLPSLNKNIPSELKNIEKKIFEKELKRYEEIAQIAINNAEVLKLIYEIRDKKVMYNE